MPSIVRLQNKKFRPNSWRVLIGLGGIPNLIMACATSLLPASPRYLLYRRRYEEALTVLRQIYAINNSKHADTYTVRLSYIKSFFSFYMYNFSVSQISDNNTAKILEHYNHFQAANLLYKISTTEIYNIQQYILLFQLRTLDNCVRPDEEDEEDTGNVSKIVWKFYIKTRKRIRKICSTPFKCTTILGLCINLLQFPG